MGYLNILIVEDDEKYALDRIRLLKGVDPGKLLGTHHSSIVIRHARNQKQADQALSEGPTDGYDIILLDLEYPDLTARIIKGDFQGMKWLPKLRESAPMATIVVLPIYAH